MDSAEKRFYQRSDHFNIMAKTSRDKRRWKKVFIHNISSGGLQFSTDEAFTTGEVIWFDLAIQGFFSEFEVYTRGEIRNVNMHEGRFVCGVVFIELNTDIKILIDENIKCDRPVFGEPYMSDM